MTEQELAERQIRMFPVDGISSPAITPFHRAIKSLEPCDEMARKVGRPRRYATRADRDRAYRQRQKDAKPKRHHRTRYTGEQEWYTPAWCLEAARQVLGTITLDPASCDAAQATVQAERYYTAQDSAFVHAWSGTVWLNPPYKQPEITHFVSRLTGEYIAGHVSQAILLTPNNTETDWYQLADGAATAICFSTRRIRFIDPSGHRLSPMQGQVLFYFGSQVECFREVFGPVGSIR